MIKSIDNIELKKELAYNLINDFKDEIHNKHIVERIIEEIEKIPFYTYIENNREIGFLSMKPLTEESAEIYFIKMLYGYEERGFEEELINNVAAFYKEKGYKLLRVKVLADGNHDELISFYRSVGFFNLEERVELEDKENKILVMIRPLV
ncbi:GNAT family N-acetyltransferase [Clostridium sp. LIBA-8841]|uniref:GNAT family N-acetyltransferase n=1 Tax=Clostridium sp. LIBA-8841 TaxID=2987530 RepID=UPI002AC3EC66|nr:GNAT family N-acetyltransferase [Clostridium sp. LIBA-8841]MDZ5253059.1 GNAT family N-acetyltransferase [Clostridium sp. LIBA-8841]